MADQHATEPTVTAGVIDQSVEARLDQLGQQHRAAQGSRFLRRIKAEKKAFLGLIFVVLLGVVAVAGPLLAPYGPDNTDFESAGGSEPASPDGY